ncbi:hypothetical protein EOD42_12290 [Rhodovarius crocodyli]|uniref:ATP-grasp domain-containing protein n=1 Tax=Rhodovarius crocodyli TaxID=1979269 RepID=A0A437ME30_9PROT|nr:hypothetical protein [Rhodovarius crocodyli]RVT95911.1 hypothetical protein EOD42_12290 [Rhodovarius crocodyli]
MKRVLFGMRAEWEARLSEGAARAGWAATMAPLDTVDLAAFDIVVPLTLHDQPILERRAAPNALFTSASAQALCHDKYAFNRAVTEAGLGAHIPPMLAPPILDAPSAYPVILKRRRDAWGEHSRILTAPPELPIDPMEEFLQCYVPGVEEWATHLLLRGGEILFEATIRYDMPPGPHVKGMHVGEIASEWMVGPVPHLACFRRILRAVGFTDGTCCFDYRVRDGVPLVFELNPRLGGSLMGRVGPYLSAYHAGLERRHAALHYQT